MPSIPLILGGDATLGWSEEIEDVSKFRTMVRPIVSTVDEGVRSCSSLRSTTRACVWYQ